MADVIVVGAGPVGLLTALALAQGGATVIVLEKEPGIVESPRAAVYFPSTLIVLEELGLLDELNAIGFQNRSFGTPKRMQHLAGQPRKSSASRCCSNTR